MLSVVLFSACSKDDSDKEQVSWDDFEFSGVFTGTFTNETSSELEGYLTIEDNGAISVELFNGSISGTALTDGENYAVTITRSSGVFETINNFTGTLNTTNRTIALSGTDVTGSSVSFSGQIAPVQSNFSDNFEKSTILFTHSQIDCVASVTVNGVTINGLESFYEDDNYCDSRYDLLRILVRDNDDTQSTLVCNTGTIIGLDGNPLPFSQCSVIKFIVDKNTAYDYSVSWNNGEVTTGQFTSADGGRFITICPTNDTCSGGNGGGGNTNGEGQFSVNGTTYNTTCASTPGASCSGSGINVVLVPEGGANSFVFYNMPVASSGTFTIADGEGALDTCELYGILNGSSQLFVTESGNLTKTDDNSFTFSGVVRDLITGETQSITGSGSY